MDMHCMMAWTAWGHASTDHDRIVFFSTPRFPQAHRQVGRGTYLLLTPSYAYACPSRPTLILLLLLPHGVTIAVQVNPELCSDTGCRGEGTHACV